MIPPIMNGPLRKVALAIVFAVAIGASGIILALGDRGTPAPTVAGGDSITFFIADGAANTGYRPADRELALWALQAWQRTIGAGVHFQPAAESSALIRLYWVESNSGTYGEMQPVMVGGRQGAAVFIQPDVKSLGPDIARLVQSDALMRESIVYLTCLHEFGHALGLNHTRSYNDIMYYFGYGGDIPAYFNRYRSQLRSRSDIATVSGLSDADGSRIRALYHRE